MRGVVTVLANPDPLVRALPLGGFSIFVYIRFGLVETESLELDDLHEGHGYPSCRGHHRAFAHRLVGQVPSNADDYHMGPLGEEAIALDSQSGLGDCISPHLSLPLGG